MDMTSLGRMMPFVFEDFTFCGESRQLENQQPSQGHVQYSCRFYCIF
jgi:hypothetical protein